MQKKHAEEHCSPKEVNILTGFRKCMRDFRDDDNSDKMPDFKKAMQASKKCAERYPIKDLSAKCRKGMGGF